jgi:hypothetical protein
MCRLVNRTRRNPNNESPATRRVFAFNTACNSSWQNILRSTSLESMAYIAYPKLS